MLLMLDSKQLLRAVVVFAKMLIKQSLLLYFWRYK